MKNKKRLIDANALLRKKYEIIEYGDPEETWSFDYLHHVVSVEDVENAPTVDAVEVVHGRWELTSHEEYSNYRWNVTAECSECHHCKGEIYAGFFSGFPRELVRGIVLDYAKSVKLDNYCPNCGAKMDGDENA